MLPSDPSSFFATGILLDVIQNYLKRNSKDEDATRFWAEWLAWGILLAVYWTIPFAQRFTTSSSSNAQLEEAIVEEKHQPQSKTAWMATFLSICLVGSRFLSESEHGKYDWLLVG